MTEILQTAETQATNDAAVSYDAIYDANGNFTGDYANAPYGTPDVYGDNYFSTANYTDNLYGGTGQTTLHYVGGNKYVVQYTTGDIIMSYSPPYAVDVDANNLYIYTKAGIIDVHGVRDEFVIVGDTEGIYSLVGYMSSAGEEMNMSDTYLYTCLAGAPTEPNTVWAGQGGSLLWGGGYSQDLLIGGAGIDLIIAGQGDGNDVILNASSQDYVFLNNVTLSDLAFAVGNGQNVAVGFNSGEVVTVQDTEALSAHFILADGSDFQYNHATSSWQSA